MSRAARFVWVCAVSAALCFVALAILSKGSLEPAGMLVFDSRLGGYDAQDARAYLEALTDEQVTTYLTTFRWLDTVFPILLAVSLLGAIWLNTKGEPTQRRLFACLSPLAYLMLDQAENAAVAEILWREGQGGTDAQSASWRLDAAVAQASIYTQAKWMTLALGLVVVIWAWRFAKKGPKA